MGLQGQAGIAQRFMQNAVVAHDGADHPRRVAQGLHAQVHRRRIGCQTVGVKIVGALHLQGPCHRGKAQCKTGKPGAALGVQMG